LESRVAKKIAAINSSLKKIAAINCSVKKIAAVSKENPATATASASASETELSQILARGNQSSPSARTLTRKASPFSLATYATAF
jgi:uncharacterized protein YoxC